MTTFKELLDVSNAFENELQHLSANLFSAKIVGNFEDDLAKKLQDIRLLSSKLKLLRAKSLATTQPLKDQSHEHALEEYGETATWKVMEQVTVKSLTQAHAVRSLITTPNSHLHPEIIQRKKAIMEILMLFSQKESALRDLEVLQKEREAELMALRTEWDKTAGMLQDTHDQLNISEAENRGPMYPKLVKLVEKLELMRWLLGQLTCVHVKYDWLADPHGRFSAIALTRTNNTIDMFLKE